MTDSLDTDQKSPPTGMADPDYRARRRRKHHPFNFELSDGLRSRLRAVADAREISMGAALRQLISAADNMDCKDRPTCVSGRPCIMPHLHPPTHLPGTQEDPTS